MAPPIPSLDHKMIVAAGRKDASRRLPYMAKLILKIAYRPVVGYKTFSMSAGAVMSYDPAKAKSWGYRKVSFVVSHESFHLWLRHHARAMRVPIRSNWDQILWNIAMDAYINRLLKPLYDGWCPADTILPNRLNPSDPDDPDTIENQKQLEEQAPGISTFQLPDNCTAEQGYWILKDKWPTPHEPPKSEEPGNGGDSEQPDGGDGPGNDPKPQPPKPNPRGPGSGHCGGCAGRPQDGEADENDPSNRTENELEGELRQVSISMQHEKNRGKVPAEFLLEAAEHLAPPEVPWEKQLGQKIRGIAAKKYGHVFNDYTGYSRHQYAFGDGVPVMPKTVAPKIEACIIVDTSGSMSQPERDAAIRETSGVIRAVGGQVWFGSCDAEMHTLEKIKRWQDATKLIEGGGGTDFVPIFEAISKMKKKPDILIIVSDCMGPAPEINPLPKTRTLWLVPLAEKTKDPCPRPFAAGKGFGEAQITWGEFLKISPQHDRRK